MALNRYDVLFPPDGRLQLDGGLNTKFQKALIPNNESPSNFNVIFGDGAVGTRGGSSQLNTTAVGSFVCDGLYTKHDQSTSAETMVAFFGGTMWQLGTTTFTTIASAQSVFNAGERIGACEYQNKLFIGNGSQTPYKYDGTYFTRHGVPQATGTVALASSAAGNIAAGQYCYKVTYRNSFAVEGDVGTAATITLTASGTIGLSSIPVAATSHGVSSRRIYRTEVGGTTYKLVTTIADNTTTTYSDTTLDVSLGVTAPTDQGEPPKYSVVAYHQNRLFCNDASNGNYLWYSELGEPYTFKVTNFLRIGDNTGDLLKAVWVYQNNIVLGCSGSPWLLYMPTTDPSDWSVIRIASPFGTKSPFGSFLFNDRIMMPALENSKFVGFASISGTSVDPSASVLDTMIAGGNLQSEKIQPDMLDVAAAYVRNISAISYKNKGFITLTKGAVDTTNNRIYVFDYSNSNITKEQPFSWAVYSGLQAAQFTVYSGNLYYGSSNAVGLVYQMETNSYTDGSGSTAINSYFWTKEFSGLKGHEHYVKDFRKLRLLVDLAGNYQMEVRYRVDSDSSEGNAVLIDMTSVSAVWNTFSWGAGTWTAGVGQKEFEVRLGQTSGKRIQFKFSNLNTSGQRFKVHGLNLSYNVRGVR